MTVREAVIDLGFVERGELTEEQLDTALDVLSHDPPGLSPPGVAWKHARPQLQPREEQSRRRTARADREARPRPALPARGRCRRPARRARRACTSSTRTKANRLGLAIYHRSDRYTAVEHRGVRAQEVAARPHRQTGARAPARHPPDRPEDRPRARRRRRSTPSPLTALNSLRRTQIAAAHERLAELGPGLPAPHGRRLQLPAVPPRPRPRRSARPATTSPSATDAPTRATSSCAATSTSPPPSAWRSPASRRCRKGGSDHLPILVTATYGAPARSQHRRARTRSADTRHDAPSSPPAGRAEGDRARPARRRRDQHDGCGDASQHERRERGGHRDRERRSTRARSAPPASRRPCRSRRRDRAASSNAAEGERRDQRNDGDP